MGDDMRVIYLAGMSHSGSTLLSLMLNAHPDICAAGELIDLERCLNWPSIEQGKTLPCGCGAPSLQECHFWTRVATRVRESEGASIADPNLLGLTLKTGPGVLRAISEVSGKRFVVESSKRPERLSSLLGLRGLDVFAVHLVRDPRGQIASLRRKNGGLLRHIVWYARLHNQLRRILERVPHVVIHYEDLARHPKQTLETILNPFGLAYHTEQMRWFDQEQHTLGGNKLRWQPRDLILDERWRESLSPLQRAIIGLGTAHSRWRLAARAQS
jgi:hypothetical protein